MYSQKEGRVFARCFSETHVITHADHAGTFDRCTTSPTKVSRPRWASRERGYHRRGSHPLAPADSQCTMPCDAWLGDRSDLTQTGDTPCRDHSRHHTWVRGQNAITAPRAMHKSQRT